MSGRSSSPSSESSPHSPLAHSPLEDEASSGSSAAPQHSKKAQTNGKSASSSSASVKIESPSPSTTTHLNTKRHALSAFSIKDDPEQDDEDTDTPASVGINGPNSSKPSTTSTNNNNRRTESSSHPSHTSSTNSEKPSVMIPALALSGLSGGNTGLGHLHGPSHHDPNIGHHNTGHHNTSSSSSTPNSRHTVPPLVFPLANIFEERTPLQLASQVPHLLLHPSMDNLYGSQAMSGAGQSNSLSWDNNISDRSGSLQCILYHKIRGGKGEWKEIVPGEMIRVTKGVGKKVKLVVQAPCRFVAQDVQLSLQDLTESGRTPRTPVARSKSSRFSVESTSMGSTDPITGKTSAELLIKLFKLSKQLMFHTTVQPRTPSGEPLGGAHRGVSIVFGTHNSGKQRRRKDRSDDEEGGPVAYNGRKQSKLAEDDDTWIDLPTSSSQAGQTGGSSSQQQQQHLHGSDSAVGNPNNHSTSESDLLDAPWPSEDIPVGRQREMIQRLHRAMRDFGQRYVMDEARKRGSGIAVYVACRSSPNQPEDFTTFVYKQENLLREDAVTMGTPLGRALFLPTDERGEYSGVYTLVAAVRNGEETTFAPNSGVAVLYDFRKNLQDEDAMKLIPIHPVWLSHDPTSVWLIGSFQAESGDISWLPPVQPPTPGPPPFTPGRGRGGYNQLVGIGPGSMGGSMSAGMSLASPHGLVGGYPPLSVPYSPRGSLHSPSPYYGSAQGSNYLAPKSLYPGGSPAPSPSTTPVPGGPPTPGLGQTPRGFSDMLHFGQPAHLMQSGFYSPMSNGSYPQMYMLDPSLILSARGMADPNSGNTGFYSPTAGNSFNLANSLPFKGGAPGSNPYGYNLFPAGPGTLQGSLQGYPSNSPRYEELLDSARM